jgi:thiol-disulfide isomerase/thioredoxin
MMNQSCLHYETLRSMCLAGMVVGWLGSQARAEDQPAAVPVTIEARLIDGAGKPVAGANVANFVALGYPEQAAKQGTEWFYIDRVKSNSDGIARLSVDAERLPWLSLVARDEARKISAIVKVDPKTIDQPISLTLLPERMVVGEAVCPQLDLDRVDGKGIIVYVGIGEHRTLECDFKGRDFQIPLPPGKYTFTVYGLTSYQTKREVVVTAGSGEQQLEPVPLQPTAWALLIGKPAPEIPGVVAWKNSPPLSLASLRGKVVIVEFWGYWCGPCVYHMPELMERYDKYHDRGLEVIGVHVDLGEDEQEPVDTVARLDARLAETRQGMWKGRDLPFPVALVVGKRTPFASGADEDARSPASACFGVNGYPTPLLIDRQGNVVGPCYDNEEGIARLEKALDEK